MTSAFSTDAAGALPGPDWLIERRRAAADRFAGGELPTAEQEVWRYSRIGDLRLEDRRPAMPTDVPADAAPAAHVAELIDLAAGADLVLWTANGNLVGTPTVSGAGSDVLLGTDARGALGAAVGEDTTDLTALHDAFCAPIQISVPEGRAVGTVVVIHDYDTDGLASFPRLVVEAGQASEVSVIEIFVSEDGTDALSFPVTELIVGRDATMRYATMQLLGDATWQIGRQVSTVAQGGTLRSGAAAFGGDYARLRVDTTLAGRGAHGDIFAGYFGAGSQLLDFRTFQDHSAPDTTSNLLFKGALGDQSASVYTGLIKIRPDARGSQAFQTNKNIKLSDEAWAESVPNLEIENNEVQCSHASTVGPVDREQRFYLESRGVPPGRAERLIVKGFFDEVVDALPIGPFEDLVRDRLARKLERTMP